MHGQSTSGDCGLLGLSVFSLAFDWFLRDISLPKFFQAEANIGAGATGVLPGNHHF
jgi:hypothetical protein